MDAGVEIKMCSTGQVRPLSTTQGPGENVDFCAKEGRKHFMKGWAWRAVNSRGVVQFHRGWEADGQDEQVKRWPTGWVVSGQSLLHVLRFPHL